MPPHPATRLLQRRLGRKVVRTDEESRRRASFDSAKISFMPEATLFPRRRSDLAAILRLANERRMPVTVRGGGTSLTGSAVPVRGGWVVDLSRWRKLRIDAGAGLAEVGAGVITADLQRAAEAAGWFYPPDPSSREFCTIGGNIACNAGGMHGAKYGVTRDFVLALKGFLPTGEYVEWGRSTRKFASGFNLRDLWIGSEGMLGIMTEATLRLLPRPAARWTLLTAFRDEVSAFRAVQRLFQQRLRPAICEFLDRASVTCAERMTGEVLFAGQPGRALVLFELAGSESEVREEKGHFLAWARKEAAAFRAARDRLEAEKLWTVRRKCSSAMFQLGDSKLNEDVVLPVSQYVRFARFLALLSRESTLPLPTFGHLGDGNLHVNVMYHRAKAKEARAAERAVARLMRKVVELGGAISGEHGIGLAKTPFLRIQYSPAEIGAMQAVKKALDPRGILNPGKLFEIFRVWEYPRLAITLPWDHR